jgi:hypothetical protein
MAELAKEEGWIIVTADIRIGKNRHETEAWKQSGHPIFFLKPGWVDLAFWGQAQKFVKCLPERIAKAKRAVPASSFVVSLNGKIQS